MPEALWPARHLKDLTDEFIDKVFDLNCRQLIHCCRLVLTS